MVDVRIDDGGKGSLGSLLAPKFSVCSPNFLEPAAAAAARPAPKRGGYFDSTLTCPARLSAAQIRESLARYRGPVRHQLAHWRGPLMAIGVGRFILLINWPGIVGRCGNLPWVANSRTLMTGT